MIVEQAALLGPSAACVVWRLTILAHFLSSSPRPFSQSASRSFHVVSTGSFGARFLPSARPTPCLPFS